MSEEQEIDIVKLHKEVEDLKAVVLGMKNALEVLTMKDESAQAFLKEIERITLTMGDQPDN